MATKTDAIKRAGGRSAKAKGGRAALASRVARPHAAFRHEPTILLVPACRLHPFKRCRRRCGRASRHPRGGRGVESGRAPSRTPLRQRLATHRRAREPDSPRGHPRAPDRRSGSSAGSRAAGDPVRRLGFAVQSLPGLGPADVRHAAGGVGPVPFSGGRSGCQVDAAGALLAGWSNTPATRRPCASRSASCTAWTIFPRRRSPTVQAGYERTRRAGFYERILRERANIESCQVNCITGEPVPGIGSPDLADAGPEHRGHVRRPQPQTIRATDRHRGQGPGRLAPGHRLVVRAATRSTRWRSNRSMPTAATSTTPVCRRSRPRRSSGACSARNRSPPRSASSCEDHLFWYAVDQATRRGLPVKLHTGYYAGQNSMPLGRLTRNAASAAELCRLSPDTQFVFMHIGYPFYEDLLAVAKHWSNAYVDMCWSWIINPMAAKDYVKKHLVTAPVNKLLPFGGDYIPVEPVLGHAIVARRGTGTRPGGTRRRRLADPRRSARPGRSHPSRERASALSTRQKNGSPAPSALAQIQ